MKNIFYLLLFISISNACIAYAAEDDVVTIIDRGSLPRRNLVMNVDKGYSDTLRYISSSNILLFENEAKSIYDKTDITSVRTVKEISDSGILIKGYISKADLIDTSSIKDLEKKRKRIKAREDNHGYCYCIFNNLAFRFCKQKYHPILFFYIIEYLQGNQNCSRIPLEPVGKGAVWSYSYTANTPFGINLDVMAVCELTDLTSDKANIYCYEIGDADENIATEDLYSNDKINNSIRAKVKLEWTNEITLENGRLPYSNKASFSLKLDSLYKNRSDANDPNKPYIIHYDYQETSVLMQNE